MVLIPRRLFSQRYTRVYSRYFMAFISHSAGPSNLFAPPPFNAKSFLIINNNLINNSNSFSLPHRSYW